MIQIKLWFNYRQGAYLAMLLYFYCLKNIADSQTMWGKKERFLKVRLNLFVKRYIAIK